MRDLSTIVAFRPGNPTQADPNYRVFAAKSILAGRAAMRAAFPAGLIHDPVTEIMMTLFIADSTDKRVRHEAACAASGVGITTATRWIRALEGEGLVIVTKSQWGESFVAASPDGLARIRTAIDSLLARQDETLG